MKHLYEYINEKLVLQNKTTKILKLKASILIFIGVFLFNWYNISNSNEN